MTRIHESLLAADHWQPAVVVTVTEPVPPAASTETEVGEIEYEHVGAPLWFTVKVRPAAVMVPERGLAELLTAAL